MASAGEGIGFLLVSFMFILNKNSFLDEGR